MVVVLVLFSSIFIVCAGGGVVVVNATIVQFVNNNVAAVFVVDVAFAVFDRRSASSICLMDDLNLDIADGSCCDDCFCSLLVQLLLLCFSCW